jgi:hypothetical protein
MNTQNIPRPPQRTLDILCIQRLCPNCEQPKIGYLVYELDNEIYFECSACPWDLTAQLDLIKDAGFYPDAE